ncbi:tail fiber protein [Escherichia coli]|uniref:Tail fiber protein n=1 Tax=Escherichia coli TaxID=562 RepID=A0A376J7J4_ECOLX|nr:tail fiber protein [Escherichia coli]
MNALTVQQAGSISVQVMIASFFLVCFILKLTGGEVSLSLLTTQAYTGRPWPLIDGVGQIYGMYVLTETNTTRFRV